MGNFFGKMTGVFCFHYLSSFFFRKIKMTSTDFHVKAIDRLCFACGIMKNGHHILLVLKEAMSLTFERSINLLENVTSSNMSQLLGTEVSAIQRCPLFRGVRYSEVSAIQRCPLFRGVRYSEVSAIQRCPLFRGVRYSEVSAISISAIGGFYCIHLSIELQTSVVETIYICLKCSHMYIYSG